MPAVPGHGRYRRLPFLPSCAGPVALAVDFTRQALAEWHLLDPRPDRPHLAEDAVLVVGELVANACRHGHGPRELLLDHHDGVLRITVGDRSHALPRPRPAADGEPAGYGILILDRLTTHWGTTPAPDGKTVWAELATAPARPAQSGGRGRM